MSETYKRIEDHDAVIRAFGYWPTFHDAEVRSMLLDRNSVLLGAIAGGRLDLCMHAFEWTRAEEPIFNHHLVCLRFHEVQELELGGFNHQNAIFELKIEEPRHQPDLHWPIKVTLVPAFGLGGSFCTASGQVLSVVPCDTNGNARSEA